MISLQRVTKTYKNGVTALTDVTVEVDKGEFVFIVGQSGSGKSTMIRLLIREEDATKGEIYVGGKNLAKHGESWDVPKLRRNVGTVFQDFRLLQDKTVFENVAFGLEVIGKQKHVIDQRVPEILEYVGLGRQARQLPRRALRRRAATGVDRARMREPPAGAARRRADRQPRPEHERRHHAAARQGEPHRHDRRDGDPRSGDRRRHAQAGDRARQGPASCATSRGASTADAARVLLPRDRDRAAAERHRGVRRHVDRVHRVVPLRAGAADRPAVQPRDRRVDRQRRGRRLPRRPGARRHGRSHPDQAAGAAGGRLDRVLGQGGDLRRTSTSCSRGRRPSRKASTARRRSRRRCASTWPTPSQFDQITAALGCESRRHDGADPVHGARGPRRLRLPGPARATDDDHARAVDRGASSSPRSCWPRRSPSSRTRCASACSPAARRSASCAWWGRRTGASACRS